MEQRDRVHQKPRRGLSPQQRRVGLGRSLAVAASLCMASVAGCIDYLEPGELGDLRYIGDFRGDDRFRIVPPISDNNGNVYHINGSSENDQDIFATVGGAQGGGWQGLCTIHKNPSRGVHGWVGYEFDRAYFWSGDALGQLTASGDCRQILDLDPVTRANLAFKAVIPWVRVTPTARTMVAAIQSPTDQVPFFVVIDLDVGLFDRYREFRPRGAESVEMLGVGADPSNDSGVFVLKYALGETIRIEGRFVDRAAEVTGTVNLPLEDLADYGQDAMVGFLHKNRHGWFAGAFADGAVLVFNERRGRVFRPSFDVVGVHRWEDETFVVGIANGRPVVAEVRADGSVAAPSVWQASEATQRSLRGAIVIQDDRFQPHRTLRWNQPNPAHGAFPFLYPHSPHRYTEATSLLSVAGPTYSAGGESFTSIAVGPAGLAYP